MSTTVDQLVIDIDQRVKNIYDKYINIVCPYVLQYELLDNTFPIEILNEIRAVLAHIAKVYLYDDLSEKEKNIKNAESHIKRAILDCHKYICMAFEDEYKKFNKLYERVDLSLVDNGKFLTKLLKFRKSAVELMRKARESEISVSVSGGVDDYYKNYEEAFIKYSSVYDLINNSFEKLENLKKKRIMKDYIAIGSFIIGIIGTVVSIISYFK